ncbi:SGNH hydrolase-type esterase domain-containing protein [Schizophyllum amplum]|uniref:SGNH hydrolase-type esterase domain-containing protein n=1 Tax=Schizophyllum amplum TaxID=97359 RepID=A0A550CAI9_9AGAR|nr:SGNH hydrolase-type esterase domain-containing protein [Auriculariopsis ampla]
MAAYSQDTIMLFGDSITQGGWEPEKSGFGTRLAHVYARKLDVLNRGLSGYNTEWGIPVFEQVFAKKPEQAHAPKVRLLLIWFGANDACIPPSPQHVPLPKFTSNLKHILSLVRSPDSPYHSPETKIVLVTPPPVNTLQRGVDLHARDPPKELDRLFEVTETYAEAVRAVGVEAGEGVAVVDVFGALWERAGKDEASLSQYLSDGLHLNGKGYEIMYDELMQVIKDKFPELHPDNLRYNFARWDEIDWKNPAPTLQKRPIEIPK